VGMSGLYFEKFPYLLIRNFLAVSISVGNGFPISFAISVYDYFVSVSFPQNAAFVSVFCSPFPFSSETNRKFPFRFQPYPPMVPIYQKQLPENIFTVFGPQQLNHDGPHFRIKPKHQ
jgi:hypothetical protein